MQRDSFNLLTRVGSKTLIFPSWVLNLQPRDSTIFVSADERFGSAEDKRGLPAIDWASCHRNTCFTLELLGSSTRKKLCFMTNFGPKKLSWCFKFSVNYNVQRRKRSIEFIVRVWFLLCFLCARTDAHPFAVM